MKGGKGGRARKSAGTGAAKSGGAGRGKPPARGSGVNQFAKGAPKKGSRKKPDIGGRSSTGEEV